MAAAICRGRRGQGVRCLTSVLSLSFLVVLCNGEVREQLRESRQMRATSYDNGGRREDRPSQRPLPTPPDVSLPLNAPHGIAEPSCNKANGVKMKTEFLGPSMDTATGFAFALVFVNLCHANLTYLEIRCRDFDFNPIRTPTNILPVGEGNFKVLLPPLRSAGGDGAGSGAASGTDRKGIATATATATAAGERAVATGIAPMQSVSVRYVVATPSVRWSVYRVEYNGLDPRQRRRRRPAAAAAAGSLSPPRGRSAGRRRRSRGGRGRQGNGGGGGGSPAAAGGASSALSPILRNSSSSPS
ncbi:hypothetical protein CBR_g39500 [Chara braunii]|uniref:Uncharacterized protein n=1 Tax=Chara braunii TaxID=69332 RepID=A0A388LRS8_CHABU|nr:hypothetical protein CBR_g39500 [Chara braunii]|eukprot:GBG85036.1 hypothetical protein CBR_g39500 [Chara braunii]